LVAEPKATWHVLDHYPGPISVVGSDWARLLLGDELGGRGTLRAGATVAHLAFYLAVYMGCDPIIFVGQDLAFTGHVFYTPGVEVHHAWRSEINRFHTMETKEWERIVRNRPILRRVDGTGGTSLYTDELLFTYLEQFEKDIAATSATVINATEGGARIRGTESVPLKQVADQYCTRAIAPQRFAYRTTTRWRDTSRLERAREELKRRVDELDAVAELCEEMLGLLDELKQLTHDPARFNRRLVRVDELRTRVRQSGRAYGIISHAMQLAEFRRFSADTKLDASRTDDVERAQHQLRRDTDFVTAVRDGATAVKSMLLSAIDRIHAAEQHATKRA
ncbi:MAG: 6-hydroxymethylpterin diphosphokinase MptE-like protein, partial [Phycisphaerae bacterium]